MAEEDRRAALDVAKEREQQLRSWTAGWERPSGREGIGTGYGLFFVALLLLAIGLLTPSAWQLIWISAALFNVGLVLWGVGQIQKAIYFLPGRDLEDT